MKTSLIQMKTETILQQILTKDINKKSHGKEEINIIQFSYIR